MLLTYNEFLTLQRVEAGMPAAVVERIIGTCTAFLQQCIGAANLATLEALSGAAPEIAGGNVGGEYFEGAKVLLSELAFSMLANENIVITGFGTVKKNDEWSHDADYFVTCKLKEAHFLFGVRQLCRLKGWQLQQPPASLYTQRFF